MPLKKPTKLGVAVWDVSVLCCLNWVSDMMLGSNLVMDRHPIQGGEATLLAALCQLG